MAGLSIPLFVVCIATLVLGLSLMVEWRTLRGTCLDVMGVLLMVVGLLVVVIGLVMWKSAQPPAGYGAVLSTGATVIAIGITSIIRMRGTERAIFWGAVAVTGIGAVLFLFSLAWVYIFGSGLSTQG